MNPRTRRARRRRRQRRQQQPVPPEALALIEQLRADADVHFPEVATDDDAHDHEWIGLTFEGSH